MSKALIVVQSRFGSSRLPGKAMYPLAGLPMLAFLLKRLLYFGFRDQLCLATTERSEDDVLAAWARDLGVAVVRGPENDLVARFLLCLEHHPAQWAIRVTADNPFTSPRLIRAVEHGLIRGGDYVSNILTGPYGGGCDGMPARVLRLLGEAAAPGEEREHINKHILHNSGRFDIRDAEVPPALARPDISLTVDTLEDHRRLVAVVESDSRAYTMRTEDVLARLDTLAL